MKRTITLLAFALAFAMGAHAFSTKYHATVAYIAEQHMTPRAKANFHKAFGNKPLVEYASYPDFFRDIYNIDGVTISHLLYIDNDFKAVSHTEGDYSAYNAILWGVNQLKNYKKMDDSLKVFALALVVHCMGDTHCPSHKKYADGRNNISKIYFTNSFKRKGSTKEVVYHAFWDAYCMDHRYSGGFLEMAYMIDTCSKDEIAKIQEGDIDDWMHATAMDCKDLYDVTNGATVDRIYIVTKAQEAAYQVRNAGYRLAALLNQIFG